MKTEQEIKKLIQCAKNALAILGEEKRLTNEYIIEQNEIALLEWILDDDSEYSCK